MKAVRFHQYGDVAVLRHEDTERPVPGPGQVLVQVAATSFNPVDAAIRAGHLQQGLPLRLPHTPGLDVAGTVAALGEGVVGRSTGEAVVGTLPMDADGAAAEFVLAPAEVLAPAPRSIDLVDAAALPSVGLTAVQALFEHADLRQGQRILINGAGGAVGGYAVQLARRAGAVVIATAGPRSADAVRAHGADEVIDRTAVPVAEAVTAPVDVVLNLAPTSPPEQAALLALVRPGGVLVTTVPGAPIDAPEGVRAVTMFLHADAAGLAELVQRVDAGELRVSVAERLPLAELAAVHGRSDAGTLRGKVVLVP